MQAVELGPVPPSQRTQPAGDLFLIFAGANIVATTLVTGASLLGAGSLPRALGLVAVGSLAGAALVAVLSPAGPRLGVPSMVAVRAVLGWPGAAFLAVLLYATNFAWIAFNNLIAASAMARVAGGPGSQRAWVALLGIAATGVVLLGPRAAGWADRLAVPLMGLTGAALTVRFLAAPPAAGGPAAASLPPLAALDVVIGYQVSWILMFADYSRYTASATRGAWATFLGLALTSLWFMPLGLLAARAAGSADPGAMIVASGLGLAGATLMGLGTLTTNFVNIYLSALALKSLRPGTGDRPSVVFIGTVGTLLALAPGAGLEHFVRFVELLGALFVPVGGVLIGRLVVSRRPIDVAALYERRGPHAALDLRACAAWACGVAAYVLARPWGATLPSLAVALGVWLLLDALRRPRG